MSLVLVVSVFCFVFGLLCLKYDAGTYTMLAHNGKGWSGGVIERSNGTREPCGFESMVRFPY